MQIKGYELTSIAFMTSRGPLWSVCGGDGRQMLLSLHSASQSRDLQQRWQSWAQLSTSRVVGLHEVVHLDDGRCAVVQMHVPGRPLDLVIGSPALRPEPIRAGIVADIAQGLRVMHSAGMVHGDVAPRNVLVDEYGRAVLVDVAVPASPGGGTPGFSVSEVKDVDADWQALRAIAAALQVPPPDEVSYEDAFAEDSNTENSNIDESGTAGLCVEDSSAVDAALAGAVGESGEGTVAQAASLAPPWHSDDPVDIVRRASASVVTEPQPQPRLGRKVVLAGCGALGVVGLCLIALSMVQRDLPQAMPGSSASTSVTSGSCPSAQDAYDHIAQILRAHDEALVNADVRALEGIVGGTLGQQDRHSIEVLQASDARIEGLETSVQVLSEPVCTADAVTVDVRLAHEGARVCQNGACQATAAPQTRDLQLVFPAESWVVIDARDLSVPGLSE